MWVVYNYHRLFSLIIIDSCRDFFQLIMCNVSSLALTFPNGLGSYELFSGQVDCFVLVYIQVDISGFLQSRSSAIKCAFRDILYPRFLPASPQRKASTFVRLRLQLIRLVPTSKWKQHANEKRKGIENWTEKVETTHICWHISYFPQGHRRKWVFLFLRYKNAKADDQAQDRLITESCVHMSHRDIQRNTSSNSDRENARIEFLSSNQ